MLLLDLFAQRRRGDFIFVRLNWDLAVRVRSLARDIVLYSWARYSTLTVPFKCAPVNLILDRVTL